MFIIVLTVAQVHNPSSKALGLVGFRIENF